jgi:hypothetical protein
MPVSTRMTDYLKRNGRMMHLNGIFHSYYLMEGTAKRYLHQIRY